VAEAAQLLSRFADDEVRILAGGQSLVPMMAFRLARPGHLIDINGLSELSQITQADGGVEIGALVRHNDIASADISGATAALLKSVMQNIAHHPIRTRGTICGSLAHADPASEWCLSAATLDAVLNVRSASKSREIDARDWFMGAMSTALQTDELVTSVRFPDLPEGTRFGFKEFSRRKGDFAICAALVVFEIHYGVIEEARIGIGGAEDHPRRIPEGEALLKGQRPSAELFARAGAAVAAALDPMEDHSTKAAYRRELASSLVEQALQEAAR
jgi:carbon-monoxide dehydrogenase medium subunit